MKMDSGEIIWRGNRLLVIPEVMAELGFEQGQTITDTQFHAQVKASIRLLELKLANDLGTAQ